MAFIGTYLLGKAEIRSLNVRDWSAPLLTSRLSVRDIMRVLLPLIAAGSVRDEWPARPDSPASRCNSNTLD